MNEAAIFQVEHRFKLLDYVLPACEWSFNIILAVRAFQVYLELPLAPSQFLKEGAS